MSAGVKALDRQFAARALRATMIDAYMARSIAIDVTHAGIVSISFKTALEAKEFHKLIRPRKQAETAG